MVDQIHSDRTAAPYVIALSQQKGGVGKTTTAVCLGAGLTLTGRRVLMLDLAVSGNLTSACGINQSRVRRSTTDLFHHNHPPISLITPTAIHDLHIIPAHPSLYPVPQELYQEPEYEQILRRILANGDFLDYDIILIDCPPGTDPLAINGMTCADLVILPIVCEYLAVQSLGSMLRLIKIARERVNPDLQHRLLLTKIDLRAKFHERFLAQIEDQYRDHLLNARIGVDVKIPESQLAGIPVQLYDSTARASRQYRALSEEISAIINQNVKSQTD